jgi:hypothetical protein
LALTALVAQAQEAAEGDPPSRVARVSWVSGTVEAQLAAAAESQAAVVNLPLSNQSQLRTGVQSRAEVRLGGTALHLGAISEISLVTVADDRLLVDMRRGQLSLRVPRLAPGDQVDVVVGEWRLAIAAPALVHVGHFSVARRINVRVFEGSVQLLHEGREPLVLGAGQQGVLDTRVNAWVSQGPAERLPLDGWAQQRLAKADLPTTATRLEADITGGEMLELHGRWRDDPRLGPMWLPPGVDAEWAPYRFGQWVWLPPWGWTWVDAAPWGFATTHYGRWMFTAGRWAWLPGSPSVRQAWAPALVGFYGAGASGEIVGWYPLAPGEAYRPAFAATAALQQRYNAGGSKAAGTAPAASHRYAQTLFANTAVPRESFGQHPVDSAAQVAISPAVLSGAHALALPAPNAGTPAPAAPPRADPAPAQAAAAAAPHGPKGSGPKPPRPHRLKRTAKQ